MKNIANNRGKIAHSQQIFSREKRIFSLHVRYLSFLSILLILLLISFWGQIRASGLAGRWQTDRDLALSGLLYSSFCETSASLRAASEAENAEYERELRIAGEAVERMRGGCALYGTMRSRRLEPYLEQLSEDCAGLSERAGMGIATDSDKALCVRLADQIDRLTEGGGELLRTDEGSALDLRISPYLDAGWQLR